MTVDQALHEMELVGHDFFLFQCADTGQPTVVYRRHAYDYGLIRLGSPVDPGNGAARPSAMATTGAGRGASARDRSDPVPAQPVPASRPPHRGGRLAAVPVRPRGVPSGPSRRERAPEGSCSALPSTRSTEISRTTRAGFSRGAR